MSDHRYDDLEVREILARATEVRSEAGDATKLPARTDDSALTVGRGLTLAQLQEVGAEAGIPAERIAEAVAAIELDRAALPAVRRQLGVDLSTAHVVRLPRMLTDEEWDRFVVRLRDTFQVRGEVKIEGSLRTWTHGHLQVLLEPLEEGARLRFKSLGVQAKSWVDGAVAIGFSGGFLVTFLSALALFASKPVPAPLWYMTAPLPFAAAGMWALGRRAAERWLPEQKRQFAQLGAEAQATVSGP